MILFLFPQFFVKHYKTFHWIGRYLIHEQVVQAAATLLALGYKTNKLGINSGLVWSYRE